mgnify:CR=1 FL=1
MIETPKYSVWNSKKKCRMQQKQHKKHYDEMENDC